jgi:hypothetical protein
LFVFEANFGKIRFWDSYWVTYDNTLSLCKIVNCHSYAGFFFINQTEGAAEGEKLCKHICTFRLLSFWTLSIIQYLRENNVSKTGCFCLKVKGFEALTSLGLLERASFITVPGVSSF